MASPVASWLHSATVIHENFVVKIFRFARSDEKFLCENSLPVQTDTIDYTLI